jgi:hypothetical protein
MYAKRDARPRCFISVTSKRIQEDPTLLQAGAQRRLGMGLDRHVCTITVELLVSQLIGSRSCCIDKTSTAELSEAINSMFRWYREATVCYAYLADVTEASQIKSSRWFTRGWTLQELVAPATVWFYALDWKYLGSKLDLQSEIRYITGIDTEVLTTGELEMVSIARRMSWAAKRQTTRIEDQAYSLMGIFDVNMPLLYGEGRKAFVRLQEETMKTSDDQSLFAWGLPEKVKTMQQFIDTYETPPMTEWRGLFADSPSEFTHCDQIRVLEDVQSTVPPIVSNNGVRIELQLKQHGHTLVQFAVLYCTLHGRYTHYLGIPMVPWGERWVARCAELVTIPVVDLVSSKSDKPFCRPSVLLVKAPRASRMGLSVDNKINLIHVANEFTDRYVLVDVCCSPHTSYSAEDTTFTLSEDKDTLHAVLYFACARHDPYELFERLRPHSKHPANKIHAQIEEANHERSFFLKTSIKNYDTTYSAVYPPFALLVGGRINNPWVEALVVLGDEDTNADFEALHTVDARLIRSWTTRRYLSSLLGQKAMVSPLSGHRRWQDTQLIMCYEYSHSLHGGRKLLDRERTCLHVDAQVTMVSKDLVQHQLILIVEVSDVDGRPPEQKADRNPRWWASDSSK